MIEILFLYEKVRNKGGYKTFHSNKISLQNIFFHSKLFIVWMC